MILKRNSNQNDFFVCLRVQKKYFADILFGGYDVKYERFVLWSELHKKMIPIFIWSACKSLLCTDLYFVTDICMFFIV